MNLVLLVSSAYIALASSVSRPFLLVVVFYVRISISAVYEGYTTSYQSIQQPFNDTGVLGDTLCKMCLDRASERRLAMDRVLVRRCAFSDEYIQLASSSK